MAKSPPPSAPADTPETLGDVLATGPLSLAAGLRCAHEIASELRDIHQQLHAYGTLTAFSIVLTQSGAHLLSAPGYADQASPERDVQSFGAVFYRMLTGTLPPATLNASDLRIQGPRTGPSRLRLAATMLALKCLANGTRLTMQQVAIEIRQLCKMLRQYEAGTRPLHEVPAPPPFLVAGAPPAAAFIVHSPAARLLAATPPLSPQPVETVPDLSPGESGAAPIVPLDRDSFGHPASKPPGEPQPAGGNCPKCDSSAIYASRARTRFERMLVRWNVPICRCYRCYHRYIVFARLKIPKDMPVGTQRKHRPRRRA